MVGCTTKYTNSEQVATMYQLLTIYQGVHITYFSCNNVWDFKMYPKWFPKTTENVQKLIGYSGALQKLDFFGPVFEWSHQVLDFLTLEKWTLYGVRMRSRKYPKV